MERWCFVGAKTFVVLVVRLEERRRFSGLVLLGTHSKVWFASTMDNLLWYLRDKEFVKSFREGSKVLIVMRGGNLTCRYLKVVVYAVGGRRRIIFIPKGRKGRAGAVSPLSSISLVLSSKLWLGLGWFLQHRC
jgi:hypothetical protein